MPFRKTNTKVYAVEEVDEGISEDVAEASLECHKLPSAPGGYHSTFNSKLFSFRATVLLCLLFTGILCGVSSFVILNFYEHSRYLDQFHSLSIQTGDLVEIALSHIVTINAQTSVYIGLHHMDKEKWPNVLTAGFDSTVEQLQLIGTITSVGVAPIFNGSGVPAFQEYYNEAYANLTGTPITPHYVHTENRMYNNDTRSGLVAPYINFSPLGNMHLFDIYNDAQYAGVIDSILECVKNDKLASFQHTERCVMASHDCMVTSTPMFSLLSPVYAYNSPNDVVGVTTVALEVLQFLRNSVPAYVSGVDIVFYLTSVERHHWNVYTFTVVHGVVQFKCNTGDCHDHAGYSDMKYHRSLMQGDETLQSSSVWIDIYPNDELFRTHHTRAPYILTFWSVIMMIFASVVFFIYDHFVQVESSAKQHVMETRRRLVRFVSHEIRTPLNTVMLGLELLHHLIMSLDTDESHQHYHHQQEKDQECSSGASSMSSRQIQNRARECQEDLEVLMDIESSTSAAVMVLNDLLDYDEIEMDLMEINMHPINAMEFIQSAIRQFNIQAKQAEIRIISNLNKTSSGSSDDVHELSCSGNGNGNGNGYGSGSGSGSGSTSESRSRSACESAINTEGSKSDRENLLQTDQLMTADGIVPLSSLFFMGDRHRLIQVFRNLISNALKFTPKYGTVTIAALWEASTNKDQVASLVFSVRDTGPGISKHNQRMLFGEGVQFDANRLQEGRGSGLGLFISKKIMAAHHGNIWATSEGEGMGSCFYLELPVVTLSPEKIASSKNELVLSRHNSLRKDLSADDGSIPVSRHESANSLRSRNINAVIIMVRTRRILVVDDAASNRKMVCKVLEVNGFIADHATDGKNCLAIMKAEKSPFGYDCILMDYMMPNMNGPEVTTHLREMGYTNPVIGLTGNLMVDDVNHFMESGADIVMPKPFNFKDFKGMLCYPKQDV